MRSGLAFGRLWDSLVVSGAHLILLTWRVRQYITGCMETISLIFVPYTRCTRSGR
jgi:hypothetical protein